MGSKLGGGSGEGGFYRRGLPNRPRTEEDRDDPKAFIKVATDMVIGAKGTILDESRWAVHQDDIDEKKNESLHKGKREGLKVLENELEAAMRDMRNDRETTIRHLGLALAYLELTEGVNEDHLDADRDT